MTLANELEDYKIVQSIPGIGEKITATTNRITKRGSSRLRHALYLAILFGIRNSRNKKLKEFYDKKKSEGKPAKVAVVACINKLLHWIYALLNRK